MQKTILIGEIGINHNGDIKLAKKIILEAKRCGFDYVKFQKRNPEISTPLKKQNDIRNTVVTFGLEVSISILNFLLKIDPNTIYISFNNDAQKNNAGNFAADKAKSKLLRYFDAKQIKIALPNKKDFGEMNSEEINQWKQNL